MISNLKDSDELDKQTGRLSAHAKIDQYVATHQTIKGCPTKLSVSMFELDICLGEGNYSTVYKATYMKTGEIFALKIVEKDKADRMAKRHPNIHNEIQMEKLVLLRLQHNPNIIQLYGTMQDVKSLYFIQELASDGELWAQMRFQKDKMIGLKPSLCKFYAAQILALEFCHSKGVIHRDLKPENVLLHGVPFTNGRVMFLKLIDFGTAYDQQNDQYNGKSKFVGTPEYMAPETIDAKIEPTVAVDIWSFGVTLYQLHTGRIPMKANSPYLTFLKTQAIQFDIPSFFQKPLVDLLKSIFQLEGRPSISEIKSHPYFAGVDFVELRRCPRVPMSTLAEICIDKTAESIGEVENLNKLSPILKATLMGHLEQRGTLASHLKYFFPEGHDMLMERRTDRHTLLGMSHAEQGEFKDSFTIMVLDLKDDSGAAVASHLKNMETPPKLLVAFQGSVRGLENVSIPVAVINGSLEDYYSFYAGGIMVIVMETMNRDWLSGELLNSKLCARHAVIVSSFEFEMDDSLINEILDAGTQVIITPNSTCRKIPPRTQHHSRILVVDTKPIRILRVQPSDIVTDCYETAAELPQWFSLEKDEEPDNQQEDRIDSDFSLSDEDE